MENFIEVIGARQHNLKNISVRIPKNKLTVLTGVSGSGKSSLAFDTIFAEGQRRYVESLSSYARQFLGVMDKPDVDRISGLSPAIAINQKAASSNPRSTVGTVTEIYDYLRVLYARIGHPHCPNCGREVMRQSVDQIANDILKILDQSVIGTKPTMIEIQSPLVVGKKGEFVQLFESLRRDGFKEVIVDNQRFDLFDDFVLIKTNQHSITLSVDRISATKNDLSDGKLRSVLRSRIAQAAQAASDRSEGTLYARIESEKRLYSQNFACPVCNLSLPEIEPRTFSFNTPYGACSGCSGLGQVLSADPEAEARIPNLLARFRQTDNESIRRRLAPFIITSTCPECQGARLKKETRSITILDRNIAQVTSMSCAKAVKFISELAGSQDQEQNEKLIAAPLVKELSSRLEFLVSVGLEYLSLDRQAGTLSAGEAQRIRLASQIGSGLTGVLYVLDEPTIGLHQRDNSKLIKILKQLRDLGNTVLVVEHDRETIESSDWVIEIGPGAGKAGGRIVAEGTVEEIKRNKKSLTGDYLSGRKKVASLSGEGSHQGEAIRLYGCSQHNLKTIDVNFPLGKFICVTGLSGSGKSTLVHDTLFHALARRLSRSHHTLPGQYSQLVLPDKVRSVSLIDQNPIGRTPRSNPATYTGVFDYIRRLFALTREARIRGFKPGRFSFNVPGGRCETCQGQGQIKVEMQFLADVYVTCEDCRGQRFNRETLEINYQGKNIAEILALSVDDAGKAFENIPIISAKFSILKQVGLGYISLGQPATILSGGEAQRLKLSRELSKIRTEHTVYILDEPTTGLHFADLQKLIEVIYRLVGLNNTVIVVEHNLDVIKNAQWIIDMGPEGGERGGKIVGVGEPHNLAKNPKSYTGQYLKKLLN